MSSSTSTPSNVNAYAKLAQGKSYEAVATISSDPSWKTEGKTLVEEANVELQEVAIGAKVDRIAGKVESAYGMLTGNQKTLTEGNLKVEKAEFQHAIATEGHLPIVSGERVKGKIDSAIGIVTGDIEKQKAGNLKAEKAEWTQG